jgi:hypothetical protein
MITPLIFNWILDDKYGGVGLIHQVGTNGVFLLPWQWTFGLHNKVLGISSLARQLLASEAEIQRHELTDDPTARTPCYLDYSTLRNVIRTYMKLSYNFANPLNITKSFLPIHFQRLFMQW